MTTTYTVLAPDGQVLGRHLAPETAMTAILLYDGRAFDIRQDEWRGQVIWELWTGRGHDLSRTMICSLKADGAAATRDIAEQVIVADWPGEPEAFADQQYDEMQAERDAS